MIDIQFNNLFKDGCFFLGIQGQIIEIIEENLDDNSENNENQIKFIGSMFLLQFGFFFFTIYLRLHESKY